MSSNASATRSKLHWNLLAVAAIGVALYFPYLDNPRVFDDQGLVTAGIARAATTPFDFIPRTFAYFTIAVIDVLFGESNVPNRMVSLALHVACGWLIFFLIDRLGNQPGITPRPESESKWRVVALVGAAAFVAHPVAVYGAGYLVQRTIVLATLFGLLSVLLLDAGIRNKRNSLVCAAALAYSASVMSKEHSIMLCCAAVLLTAVSNGRRPNDRSRYALYALLCVPAAWLTFSSRGNIVAHAYEPDIVNVMAHMEIGAFSLPMGTWLVSAVVQMGLFWDYLALWLFPDPGRLSIDLRVDFEKRWELPWSAVRVIAFAVIPLGFWLAVRSKSARAALSIGGLMWIWLLYATELVSVRFQEPFVLYRSYLWAPGLFLAVAPWAALLSGRTVLFGGFAALIALVPIAINRLDTFTSGDRLWADAAEKLPDPRVPGAVRVYYNRGLSRVRLKQFDAAMEDFEHIASLAPNDFRAFLGRGFVKARLKRYDEALEDLDRAWRLKEEIADIHFHRALVLEKLGRLDEARMGLERAVAIGHLSAGIRLKQLGAGRDPRSGSESARQ